MAIQVVILAAGKGKRMNSPLPKVLHPLAGKPLIEHVVQVASKVSETQPIIVYGYQGQLLKDHLSHLNVRWIEQTEQLGTGHAVQSALPNIHEQDDVVILYADVPLISQHTLNKLITTTPKNTLGMVSAHLDHPHGYGRIKRDHEHKVIAIIEEKDASVEDKQISEINPGIYFVNEKHLKRWLANIDNHNQQNEYYLTDIVSRAKQENIAIHTISPQHVEEILGVNDRIQLARLERFYQQQYAEHLMSQGITIYDPARLDIRGDIKVGVDTTIDINVICEGRVVIGRACMIGPNVILRNSMIGDECQINANSVIDGAEIAAQCVVGPFARIRPGTKLDHHAHVGNFVEIKNSFIGQASKINHLSYIGDSDIGIHVNIGAGTITCNYDGVNKYHTIIGDYVFIGSDTQLVAPVQVGQGATIAAGSTITKNVPEKSLTLTQQLHQRSIENWKRKAKKELVE